IADMRNQLNPLNTVPEAFSQQDSLTQIYHRRTFNELAQQQWRNAVRQHQPMSALIMNVDHFKPINDNYGHPAGDECLKKISHTIKGCLHRPGDLLGRYGGEEFVVLLPETDSRGALRVAESINKAIAALGLRHAFSSTANVVT